MSSKVMSRENLTFLPNIKSVVYRFEKSFKITLSFLSKVYNFKNIGKVWFY